MTQAFLSRSFSERHAVMPAVAFINQAAEDADISVYDFVSVNQFDPHEAVMMMRLAFNKIQAADFLIAEVSYKAIGVGIELGYAAALNKPILALRLESAKPSTTVGGIATLSLVYDHPADLVRLLPPVLQKIIGYLV